ncbi:growth hormone secretagogue receptor type 1-like [Acropora millepora]|uniref:growth hormone secretagogue receptor type 1-like n=1 Tax=Acropora millepora TaxID=45264 RepID=UPI001CF56B1F|nr:growth hormone secretagogue receptor type 1-like [Acropora millepora]
MNNTTGIAGSSPTISYQLSKAEGIAFSSVFIMGSFFIVAGNLFTIVLFAVSKKLRKRSLFLVMNMAVSDLLMGFVSLPIFIFMNGDNFRLGKVKTNQDLFLSFIFVDTLFSQVSLISAVSISLERFHAICWPFRHRALSMRAYKIGILFTWTIAFFVASILTLLVWFRAVKSAIYVWTAYAVAILLIVCGCNIGIWRRSRRKARIISSRNRLNIERLTYTLLFVSFLALVCWIPLVIINYLTDVFELSASWLSFASITANFLNYFNSCVNPMVYAYRVPEFRQESRLCCLDKREQVERSDGKNTVPTFKAQNNQLMDTEL